MASEPIFSSATKPLTMDDVPEFATFLHKSDPTFGVPNELNLINDYALYVQYPSGYWTKFVKTVYNSHQLEALQQFIKSGEKTKDITIPHPHGGIFVATFFQSDRINENYNKIYSYKRENGTHVCFLVSYGAQIGFINRISCEPVG
jgi:hypothetical protein